MDQCPPDRSWMYARLNLDGTLNDRFLSGLDAFMAFACSQPAYMSGSNIRCPCPRRKCRNRMFLDEETVKYHIISKGFIPGYYVWDRHGEPYIFPSVGQSSASTHYEAGGPSFQSAETENPYYDMVMDAAGPSFEDDEHTEETPNVNAQRMYDMLDATEQELWPGCDSHTLMSAVTRMMNIKAEHHMSERCYDDIAAFLKESYPPDNVFPANFRATKKLAEGLGLPCETIHCCKMGCMIYWGEDSERTICKFCENPRYEVRKNRETGRKKKVPSMKMWYFPLTPRLQRLYASTATAAHMRWHAEHEEEDGVMRHPSDAVAWKHFNSTHPSFEAEIRNVRLGLSTDGFQPFGGSGSQYSSWPVVVTPYNLPPNMCMKDEFFFLTVVVPGPKNPKQRIDVFLQPLIAELIMLWEEGVVTWDASLKQNFLMRAALMWTVSDFPAYSMLSGWTTAGLFACPYCMRDSGAFTLPRGRKTSWFDCHRKFLPHDHAWRRNKKWFIKNRTVTEDAPHIRTGEEVLHEINEIGLMKVTDIGGEEHNAEIARLLGSGWKKRAIFWDLPYWSTLLIRHNLDVMHIEKNFFDNIFNTVMNIEGKSKDNAKSREDLKTICRRPELERNSQTGKYPKAPYTLDRQQKQMVCEWVKQLRFPDGYVSNMSRCVDMGNQKLFGMKSHDCHVFMQRLLPIAFRDLLPEKIWEALSELSAFFRVLTTTTITSDDMLRLQEDIPKILCKLERYFPPSFFDSMEHLPIHLAYEAWLGGPVQYRWMYPFERFLGKLKKTVRNKARVEGSIANAYLVDEMSSFSSHYFEPHVHTRHRKVPRNDDGGDDTIHAGNLSIFTHPGRPYGRSTTRQLSEEEFVAAHNYILFNCEEVDEYVREFCAHKKATVGRMTGAMVQQALDEEFASWFYEYARDPMRVPNEFVRALASRPLLKAKSFPVYFVNGFKFHTTSYGATKATANNGVAIKGSNYSQPDSINYYGLIDEILIIEYPRYPLKETVLFKVRWFDPTPGSGTRVYPNIQFVEVNHRKRLRKYEPFILASQAVQVYYATYPSVRRERSDWWAVCTTKARHIYEGTSTGESSATPVRTSIAHTTDAFQDERTSTRIANVAVDDDDVMTEPLFLPTAPLIKLAEDDNSSPDDQVNHPSDDDEDDEDEDEDDDDDDEGDYDGDSD